MHCFSGPPNYGLKGMSVVHSRSEPAGSSVQRTVTLRLRVPNEKAARKLTEALGSTFGHAYVPAVMMSSGMSIRTSNAVRVPPFVSVNVSPLAYCRVHGGTSGAAASGWPAAALDSISSTWRRMKSTCASAATAWRSVESRCPFEYDTAMIATTTEPSEIKPATPATITAAHSASMAGAYR